VPLIDFGVLIEKIVEVREKKVFLTFHSMGDSDSISSAIAMSKAFKDFKIGTPDILTSNAARIMKKLGFEDAINNEFDEDAEAIILFDVNNFEGCGNFSEKLSLFKGPIIAIDHHKAFENKENFYVYSNEGYNSAASIVFDILDIIHVPIEASYAKFLAIGIISDSAEFKNSNSKTFKQLGKLFEIANTDYITLLEDIEHVSPASERIKTIEDLFKATAFVEKNLLFIYGTAHAYANLAADMAIRIGSDITLFWSVGEKEISFSARMKPNLDKKYNIHLGVLMKELSVLIKGTGGGHPCAAGAYGKDLLKGDEFARAFIEEIRSRL
jgi:nanoRNase/pAp phosphatase (c-di-AMP/oligoRNAs hydrolase)